uniref:Uncharacterized protein n=1 Tax=Anopheles coluzzii TaxID=1518534 RepID=A0A8W7NZD7_ANOCL
MLKPQLHRARTHSAQLQQQHGKDPSATSNTARLELSNIIGEAAIPPRLEPCLSPRRRTFPPRQYNKERQRTSCIGCNTAAPHRRERIPPAVAVAAHIPGGRRTMPYLITAAHHRKNTSLLPWGKDHRGIIIIFIIIIIIIIVVVTPSPPSQGAAQQQHHR